MPVNSRGLGNYHRSLRRDLWSEQAWRERHRRSGCRRSRAEGVRVPLPGAEQIYEALLSGISGSTFECETHAPTEIFCNESTMVIQSLLPSSPGC